MSNTRGPDIFEVCDAQAAEIADLQRQLAEAKVANLSYCESLATEVIERNHAAFRARVETLTEALLKARQNGWNIDTVEAADAALAGKGR